MNIFIIKTIKIRSYEMGLYFRDGEFKGLLREGGTGSSTRWARSRLRSSRSATRGWSHEKLDVIVKSGALRTAPWCWT